MGLLLIFIIVVGVCVGVCVPLVYRFRKDASRLTIASESLFIVFYGFTFAFFAYVTYGSEYYQAINPVENNYTAFSGKHIVTLLVYLLLFLVSAVAVWFKGRKLPPLTLVLCVISLLIGIVISMVVMGHVSDDPTKEFPGPRGDDIFLLLYPLMNIILAVVLITRVVTQEIDISAERQYENKFLNQLNKIVAREPLAWAFVLLLPAFVILTLILILFGQKPDSIAKVFTETTTWRFSQQMHPPYLDHHGHYLCTIAACGHPKLVKPARFGKRHGNKIIVNRQLMIANAYEEMISDYAPVFHRFARRMYDKCGYALSKRINTPFRSDVIYLLMKPLEWFFLINLYLFCTDPEKKINRQYL